MIVAFTDYIISIKNRRKATPLHATPLQLMCKVWHVTEFLCNGVACVVYWSDLAFFFLLFYFQNGACPFNSNNQEEYQIKKKKLKFFENLKVLENCYAQMSNRKKITIIRRLHCTVILTQ